VQQERWSHPYFRTKVALARAAETAASAGLDLVTVLPTYVLSAFGERGRQEPLLQAHRAASATGFVPSVPLDVVPVAAVAAATLLVALEGATGERYQLCGVETDTCALHAASLRHLGLRPRPWPVPRAELLDELRLLAGRPRRNAWMQLALLPWDLWRGAALRSYEVEAWHLALLLEGSARSAAKLRCLSDALAPNARAPRYPDAEEMARAIEREARRKAAWMVADGLLPAVPGANPHVRPQVT
jgi:hypothetical protein